MGQNVGNIWESLYQQKDRFNKSEYETQAAFDLRLSLLSNGKVFAGKGLAGNLAVVLPLEVAHYDADKRELQVNLPVDELSAFSDETPKLDETPNLGADFPTWKWANRWYGSGNYIGSNAFGVKKVISRGKEIEISIAAPVPEAIQSRVLNRPEYSKIGGTIGIPMSPESALLRRKTLRALIIGPLTQPFISNFKSRSSPTVDVPSDIDTTYMYLYMKIEQLWFFDQATGEIFLKLRSDDPILLDKMTQ